MDYYSVIFELLKHIEILLIKIKKYIKEKSFEKNIQFIYVFVREFIIKILFFSIE